MTLTRLRPGICALVVLLAMRPIGGADGQTTPAPAAESQNPPRVMVNTDRDARETRQNLELVLKRLPPSVGRVLRIDPALMANQSYLTNYPALSAFLQAHPDVAHNPDFYLENIRHEFWNPPTPRDARSEAITMWHETLQGMTIFTVFVTITVTLAWIVRTLIEYRRWYRVSRVQAEVHNKLLDRFTANEDLLAYIQTSPGRHFLESAPLSLESPARTVGAPLSRILWSVQAGVVLAAGALGILYVSTRVMDEVGEPLFGIGVLVLAVGAGFVVSAAASLLLSRRLGLVEPVTTAREPSRPSEG
jgi:hypothetical protein